MLAAAGRDVSALECGTQWPRRDVDVAALTSAGEKPTALFNNCSGKHAGFVCLAQHMGVDHHGYCAPDHLVQREVMATLSTLTGVTLKPAEAGIDGCSAPNWPIPLSALATGFARFITGQGLNADRARAAARLARACAAEPFMVAGTGRFCTTVMTALGARAFVKTGAEGVFCGAFPELGYGVALKCADGATRASEVMMATLIAGFVDMSANEEPAIAALARAEVTNWNGIHVGEIRAAADFRHLLQAAGRPT